MPRTIAGPGNQELRMPKRSPNSSIRSAGNSHLGDSHLLFERLGRRLDPLPAGRAADRRAWRLGVRPAPAGYLGDGQRARDLLHQDRSARGARRPRRRILAVAGVDTILVGPTAWRPRSATPATSATPRWRTRSGMSSSGPASRCPGRDLDAVGGPGPRASRAGFAWATVGADYGFMLAAAEAAARESRQT